MLFFPLNSHLKPGKSIQYQNMTPAVVIQTGIDCFGLNSFHTRSTSHLALVLGQQTSALTVFPILEATGSLQPADNNHTSRCKSLSVLLFKNMFSCLITRQSFERYSCLKTSKVTKLKTQIKKTSSFRILSGVLLRWGEAYPVESFFFFFFSNVVLLVESSDSIRSSSPLFSRKLPWINGALLSDVPAANHFSRQPLTSLVDFFFESSLAYKEVGDI